MEYKDVDQIIQIRGENWKDTDLINVYLKEGWRLIAVKQWSKRDEDYAVEYPVYVIGGESDLPRYAWVTNDPDEDGIIRGEHIGKVKRGKSSN